VGYQIVGPYPCQQSFFDNCKSTTANSNTGSTLYVGAPTGTANLLTFLLTGSVPNENMCFPPSNWKDSGGQTPKQVLHPDRYPLFVTALDETRGNPGTDAQLIFSPYT
jgi:hypothetical protein